MRRCTPPCTGCLPTRTITRAARPAASSKSECREGVRDCAFDGWTCRSLSALRDQFHFAPRQRIQIHGAQPLYPHAALTRAGTVSRVLCMLTRKTRGKGVGFSRHLHANKHMRGNRLCCPRALGILPRYIRGALGIAAAAFFHTTSPRRRVHERGLMVER